MAKCKLKLDTNESAVLELILEDWFSEVLSEEVRDWADAEITKYNAEVVISIVDKIGKAHKEKWAASYTHSLMTEELAEWVIKNRKFLED